MSNPSPKKMAELLAQMQRLEINESDLVEDFIRGSGAGGQKINKTSVCVRLKHGPSGIEVRCQESRSQAMNRFLARRLLCDKIAAQVFNEQTEAIKAKEKIRRQKRKRSKRAKEKMLHAKKAKGATKKLRGKLGVYV